MHRPEYDRLRELVAGARLASGLSQRQVSRRLGMAPTYVSKVERGERLVNVLEFIELLLAVDADPRVVFGALCDEIAPACHDEG